MWLTTTKVSQLEGISRQAVEKRIKSGKYAKVRETTGKRRGRGGRQWEIHLSSLSEVLREKYLNQIGRQTELELKESKDLLRDIAPWRQEEARRRQRLVLDWHKHIAEKPEGTSQKMWAEQFVNTQKKKDRSLTLSRSTLMEWDKLYGGKNALLALLPKDRQRGGSGGCTLDDGMIAVIEQQYLTQARRSVRTTWRRVGEYCLEVGQASPSERTIRRYIDSQYPPAVQAFHRDGQGTWRRFFEPIVHRDYTKLPVNGIWCGDQRTMDTLLKIPHGNKYLYKRPTLTLWIDVKSACAVGYHLSFEFDAFCIALALRRGFLRFGLPSAVYMDNGKNYRSIYLNGKTRRFEFKDVRLDYNKDTRLFLDAARPGERNAIIYKYNAEERGLLEALDIKVRHSRPVNNLNPGSPSGGVPRAKPVEPYFNIFHEIERELPGWCGHNTTVIPEKLKREIKADQLLTLAEYRLHVERFIEEQNHTKHGWRPITSIEFYADVQATFARERDLDLLLRPKKQKMVKHSEVDLSGQVKGWGVDLFPNFWFCSPDLAEYSGQYVTVWYDPLDLSNVVITTSGAHPKFICQIERTDLASWAPTAREMKAAKRRQKHARKAIKEVRQHQHVLDSKPEDLLEDVRREKEPPSLPVGGPDRKVIKLTEVSQAASDLGDYQQRRKVVNAPDDHGETGKVYQLRTRQLEPEDEITRRDRARQLLYGHDEEEDEDYTPEELAQRERARQLLYGHDEEEEDEDYTPEELAQRERARQMLYGHEDEEDE